MLQVIQQSEMQKMDYKQANQQQKTQKAYQIFGGMSYK